MEEAVVSLAIEKISNLLIREAAFLGGVREDVDRLMAELRQMQSFLKDADRVQKQDERLRNRVAEIRDLAYDAEDVIDAFILKVAHQEGFQGIIKGFTSIFTKPVHMHKTGVQVKAIRTKLEDISNSLPAYEIPGEGEGSGSTSTAMQQQLRKTYSHVEEEDPVGLEDLKKDVLARLMKEEEEEEEHRPHVVVSIVGMGGIGKTTLARKAYNHIDVKRHFHCFAWACISQKFILREVLHDVLIQVHTPSKEERKSIDKMKEDELIRKLPGVLKGKRYLIVLDDIWRCEDWNLLKPAFPRGKRGSKILFTTRIKDVALLADPKSSSIELPFLTEDESWGLLKRKAFPGNATESDADSKQFEMLGREMVEKCGGLPLAIVVLGGMLATKKSLAQWEMVQRNIRANLNKLQHQDDQYGAVNGILALSYNELPYYLKPCFLYLGHYPEDWEISKKELFRLWIAEGFISPSRVTEEMLMEDVAEGFLEELISRCLVQVGKRDYTGIGVKTCHIHDLLRDLCVDKARKENFFEIIQPSLVENDSLPQDVSLSTSMARRVAIRPSDRYAISLKGEHPKLRSLILFQNKNLIELSISKCKRFKFLRVLKVLKRDDSNWRVSSEIGHLQLLKYLELECSGDIILPHSIGKLRNLYTLRVRSNEVKAPNVLFELERLKHLLFSTYCPRITGRNSFSPQRSTSKNIETLKHIGSESLAENCPIFSLVNIQSLCIFFNKAKDVEPIPKELIKLHCLRSLGMRSFESFPDASLEPLSQCSRLSKLSLDGRIEEDPHSSHHVLNFVPKHIVKLTFYLSELRQDPMVVLEKLPCLRILILGTGSYRGAKLICSANGFLQLDSLTFLYLSTLEEWEIEEGAMPLLQSLHLTGIPNLRTFPEGLRYLTALQEMKLADMKRSLVERIEVIDGREGEDFSKVSHIPSILISSTQD